MSGYLPFFIFIQKCPFAGSMRVQVMEINDPEREGKEKFMVCFLKIQKSNFLRTFPQVCVIRPVEILGKECKYGDRLEDYKLVVLGGQHLVDL